MARNDIENKIKQFVVEGQRSNVWLLISRWTRHEEKEFMVKRLAFLLNIETHRYVEGIDIYKFSSGLILKID